jgi:hypothetical protein
LRWPYLKEIIHGEPNCDGSSDRAGATAQSRLADTQEEAKAGFKKRYAEVKGRK